MQQNAATGFGFAERIHCWGVYWLKLPGPSPTENGSAGYWRSIYCQYKINRQYIRCGVEH